MKYIIKPAIPVYGKYVGDCKNVELVKGQNYLLSEISVTREGNMYVQLIVIGALSTATVTPPIGANHFEFVDDFGFKYEPPFRKGMSFKYEYSFQPHIKLTRNKFKYAHMSISYSFNTDSCDGVYVVYPLLNDSAVIRTPLLEGTFNYSSDTFVELTIKSRLSSAVTGNTTNYYLNHIKIATLIRNNDTHQFTRYMITDNVNEYSAFMVSKFRDNFVKYISTPSKYLHEAPGFTEVYFN